MDWKKYMLIALDVFVGIYLILAITAFNKPDEKFNVCNGIKITIEQESADGFLTENSIRQILQNSKLAFFTQPMPQPMRLVNTRQVEEILQGHDLIEEAQCYKSIDGMLCINIRQRVPVVRVMSQTGEDYYVDTHGDVIQHNNYTCNLLLATGCITKSYASKVLAPIACQIQESAFWHNQIVQLNVLPNRSIEIVPRVGSHIAYLGAPKGIPAKLDRLEKFYRYGLSQTGWNIYSRISVEFDNQIICKKKK